MAFHRALLFAPIGAVTLQQTGPNRSGFERLPQVMGMTAFDTIEAQVEGARASLTEPENDATAVARVTAGDNVRDFALSAQGGLQGSA